MRNIDVILITYSDEGPSWSWSYCLCNPCLSPLMLWLWIMFRQGVFDTTLCDNVCQWLAVGSLFSLGTPVSSTNKTEHHGITEILLKVVLNTITLNYSDVRIHKKQQQQQKITKTRYYMHYRDGSIRSLFPLISYIIYQLLNTWFLQVSYQLLNTTLWIWHFEISTFLRAVEISFLSVRQ